MKILITGNMGYVGPGVVSELRACYPDATLIGYDMGYFASSLTNAVSLPENLLNAQIFGDIRNLTPNILEGIDVVIHLAAISNDAMGHLYEEITMEVNFMAGIEIAQKAKQAGARAFIFASSCSVYGFADQLPRSEGSTLNPLTAYARSKVLTEKGLELLADENFTVTCLRFATACGMSPRLRLDLVLNDFVAGAVSSGKINILSDGTPWRPLIHVRDMARAMCWATQRTSETGGSFLAVNAGSNDWNYRIQDLARAVAQIIPGIRIQFNKNAQPDKRSYRVNFELFQKLAPNAQPIYTLSETIEELYNGLMNMEFRNTDFRNSLYMRLKLLTSLQENKHLDKNLQWTLKTGNTQYSEPLMRTV